jgi:subtilisin-like proprotein convertase family protein
MQPKFTQKKFGKFFRLTPVFFVLFCHLSGNISAQTTITTETGTNFTGANGVLGNAAITFVVENTNSFPITLTKVDAFFDPTIITGVSGTVPTLWYSSASLSGAPTIATPAWTSLATGSPVTIPSAGYYNVLSGLSLSIPGGTSYRFALQSSLGVSYSGAAGPPSPDVFSALGVNLKVGAAQISGLNIGYGGTFPSPPNNPRWFTGRITFTSACTPVNATAPIISSVPSTTCAGSPITLNVLGGNLNGAANWVWYSGASCGGTPIGTGTSITVSPAATTTYSARGEGGCAPGPGACGSQLVTVTPCTCISPDVSTICSGSIQRLRINGTGPASSSGATSGAITVNIPDASAVGATHTIPVTLPAGATLTGVSVNFNMTHTFDGDMQINVKAPNGQVLNLVNQRGGGGDNFVNTTIAAGGASLATGVAPFTGTFAPDAALNVGPTGFASTATSFNQLLSVGNGDWTIAMRDLFALDLGILTSWTVTFNYTLDPTGVWTGPAGTIFTNPAATTAYLAGSQANVVWVKPSVVGANNYVATLASGPCAGANNITVNVLATPVVTVSPNTPGGVCSPANLTASGANIYNWTPATGLNTTTGATVIATTPVDRVYSVTGIGTNGCTALPVTVPVKGSSVSAVISSLGAPPTIIWNQGFEATSIPAGWAQQNLSSPVGSVPTWIFGTATVLSPAQNGTPNSYVLGNFNNVAGNNTISNWLFAPTTTLANGDQIVFYTRTVAAPAFPDRLQVRMSTNGASVNAGSTNTSVGDFTTLLLDINPGLTATGYPSTWTQFTATVSGLAAPVSGRIAFRYFVTSGGPAGANSDNVGIDNVTYQKPALATCANTTSTIKVDITGGFAPYKLIYSNGTSNTTFDGYTSGTPIQVSPAVTTTYTIVSVTGSNECTGSGNTGSAVITVTPPPSITTQPANRTTCVGLNPTFTVAAGPSLGTNYQWQISTNGGTSYTDLTNVAPYSGVTTPTLTITGATTAMNLNRFRVVITGACPPNSLTSAGATLFVNEAPLITTQPVATTRCVGTAATFTVVASTPNGPAAPTYQWQVSTNSGLTYTNIAGATGATLTIASVASIMNNNLYQCIVTTAPCAATVTSNAVRLTVNLLPTITISAPVTQLIPGRTTTITAATTPGPLTPASFVWSKNGATVTGATTSTIPVDIDKIGTYRATVTDVNGCVATSSNLVIGTEASDKLWIYPNPTDGAFQVRLYFPNFNVSERREVSVWNSNGQMVARKSLDFIRGMSPYSQVNFDLSGLGAGTYLVKVTDKSTSRIASGLLVIQ